MGKIPFFSKFRDLSILGISNVIITIVGGVFWFYIASLIQVDEYGKISYVLAVAGITSGISLIGSNTSITVFTSKGEKILETLSILVLIISAISSIILYYILGNISASIYVIVFAMFTLLNAELLGKKNYVKYSKNLITQRVLMVGFSLVLYYIIGYEGIILGIALSFLPLSIQLFGTFKNFSIKITELKDKKNFLINNYLLDLSRLVTGTVDKIIIAPLFGFIILGNYYLGIQVFTVISLIPTVVYQYSLPQDASKNSPIKLKKLTILFSLVIASLGYFLAPLIIPIMFPKYTDAVGVIKILSLVAIPTTINLMYTSKLLGGLNSKIVLIGSLVFLPIHLVGIVVFGKIWGAEGLAIALLLADVAHAIYYFIVDKFTKLVRN
jgi:O-antigen/teichoic acid export membrane protein